MASFYSYDFVYDDVASQQYDLMIITFDDGSPFNGVGSTSVNVINQRVLRKSKPYYLGRTQEPVLEFPITFGRKDIVTGLERDTISKWLFGRSTYKKLYIIQDDLSSAYYNCFFNNPSPVYIGGLNYAFECTVICDSPFAYSPLNKTSGSHTDFTGLNYSTTIYNNSSEDEYLYPSVSFKMSTSGSTISITNQTDDNREFVMGLSGSPLSVEEEITVDNDLQIITTSTGLKRVPTFNKNWLRLLPGANDITISGSVAWFQIDFHERMKIGG
jgi:hypothetical protein